VLREIKRVVRVVPDAVANSVIDPDSLPDRIIARVFHGLAGEPADRWVITVDDRGWNKIRFKRSVHAFHPGW